MISKQRLQSVISKYYLNGICETVKWDVKDDKINIKFISPNKDMVGDIEASNFSLKNCEVAIFDTTKLNRLISITNGEIFLDAIKEKTVFTKLEISDKKFTALYSLASLSLIPKIPKEIQEPKFHFEIDLDNDDIQSLLRAKNSLQEIDIVFLRPWQDVDGSWKIEMMFGEDNQYSNKISYYLQKVKSEEQECNKKIAYQTNILKEIFYCNKDCKEAKIYLSLDGLMKLEFEIDEIKSKYWLVGK